MNEKKELLNEEKYLNTKNNLIKIAKIVLVIGLSIAVLLAVLGFKSKNDSNNENGSNEALIETNNEELASLKEELNNEKANLRSKKTELENLKKEKENTKTRLEREKSEIFTNERGFTANYYAKEDEIKAVSDEISTLSSQIHSLETYAEKDFSCNFLTNTEKETTFKTACDLEKKISEKYVEIDSIKNEQRMSNYSGVPYFMFIMPVVMITLMISGVLFSIAKRREILAYQLQGTMPLAQEGLEKFAPTVGKVGSSLAKEMAPAMGDIAKEISKGIKEGLKDDKETKEK